MIQFAEPPAQAQRAYAHPEGADPGTSDPETAQRLAALADTERLGDEIALLSAHLHAATYRLLVLICEFDAREGWAHGFRSCAHWLSWRTGIGPGAAREKVRVARALASLPCASAEMERGALSFSKARALTRIASPENEAELVELARNATASHIERIAAAWRRVDRLEDPDQERARHEGRRLDIHQDIDGTWVVRGRLDPEVGALLQKALEWAQDQLYRQAPVEARAETTVGQRRADAVGLLAERALAGSESTDAGCDRERPMRRAAHVQIVHHIGPAAPLAAGLGVSAETSRRLACDAGLVLMTRDERGRVLDVGRKRRTVPSALARALEARDGHCRFPGCGVRHVDAHHITHWADGGHTRLDNLVLLCRRHHRAVHEDGWGVRLDDDGRARFTRPGGRPLPAVPAPPAVPNDTWTSLEADNVRNGIEPDPSTATPLWNGDPLDIHWAVYALRPG